jgi:cobalt-precorrin-6B (C15)-methyltransferase
MSDYIIPAVKDDDFIRGSAPMTKEEVRILTSSKMKIKQDSRILDIGGGTGSTAIEFALLSKDIRVTVIEKGNEAVELIKKNAEKFGVKNIKIVHGEAPKNLPDEMFDRVFIGGSGKNIREIFKWIECHLTNEGIVAANGIAVESIYGLVKAFEEFGYEDIDITQVNIAKGKKIADYTMMMGNNPITIISGKRSSL